MTSKPVRLSELNLRFLADKFKGKTVDDQLSELILHYKEPTIVHNVTSSAPVVTAMTEPSKVDEILDQARKNEARLKNIQDKNAAIEALLIEVVAKVKR